ncbi:MFS transporter [Nakamurella endophytica]|uniref:MFS transporter n=1 Tax=Nakamurella endophytica TaxID=1748367 RepID=A0A917SYU9_9ACTN|nr:MFS transporter [Nakamurella endophytica]GGM04137.1 MFS transporter [Nakamurella endophytica]
MTSAPPPGPSGEGIAVADDTTATRRGGAHPAVPGGGRAAAGPGAGRRPSRGGRWLVVTAVVLLSLTLRPAVNGMGAVVPELRAATGLTGSAGGVLLALPTFAFAVMGAVAAAIAARVGTHRTVVLALVALTAGQLVRAAVPGTAALFGGSALALAGVAVANVLLPGLVRLHFPQHVTAMTGVYTTAMSAGSAVAAGVTLPLEHAWHGDWRLGIGMWAVTSAVALAFWVPLVVGPRTGGTAPVAAQPRRLGIRDLLRAPLAWVMAGYFGTQALQAYVLFGWLPAILTDAGMSDTVAALYVSLLALVGVVVAAIAPVLLARLPVAAVVSVLAGCYLAGYLGLLFAPARLTWLWCTAVGFGSGAFPVALTLVALRARTAAGTVALSAFTQSLGYLLASVGPFLFGLLHDLVGGWTVSLLALCGLLVVHLVFGLWASRPRQIEDELPRAVVERPGVAAG